MNTIARTLEQVEQLEQERRQEGARTHKVWVSEVSMDGSGQNQPPQEKPVLDVDPHYLKRALRERCFVDDWAISSLVLPENVAAIPSMARPFQPAFLVWWMACLEANFIHTGRE